MHTIKTAISIRVEFCFNPQVVMNPVILIFECFKLLGFSAFEDLGDGVGGWLLAVDGIQAFDSVSVRNRQRW